MLDGEDDDVFGFLRELCVSIATKDFVVNDVPGPRTGRVSAVRRQARLEFSYELIRHRQQSRILDDRIPDLTDQLEPLGKRQLPDFCDVFHVAILHPASNGKGFPYLQVRHKMRIPRPRIKVAKRETSIVGLN